MVIRELYETERADMLALLTELDDSDRYRRFGRSMADAAVRDYVAGIAWRAGLVLGAFDAAARLVGVLELADLPDGACEIAVVVARALRGQGIGTALMDRALLKAKVRGRERVVLLCQVDNEPMRRLARSAGLHATQADGEVEGSLDLPGAALADLTEAAARDAIGHAAYASPLATRTWAELLDRTLRAPEPLAAS
jgi:RimJ/RimL family protein N-acetyltransferase